jgi:hypothetical protein
MTKSNITTNILTMTLTASLSICLCLGLPNQVSAQESKEKEGATITAFNGAVIQVRQVQSYKMKLIAQALLFNLECSTGDVFRLGAGLTGDYYLPKFASVHAEYFNSYFNIQKFDAKTLNKSDNALKGFSLFEIGGRFHIIDKEGKARHKLILSQHTDYTYGGSVTTTRYLKAKFPCRRIFALRGGLYGTTAPVSTDMSKTALANSNYGTVKTKDGTVFSDVYFTNEHTTGFYLGLSDLINMSVLTSFDGGNYNTSFLKEIYTDVLIAGTSFDPILAGGKSHEIEPNATGSFQTTKIGWRVGKKMIFTRKTLNMGFSFEMGDRPGVQGKGLYFGCGWSMAFVK